VEGCFNVRGRRRYILHPRHQALDQITCQSNERVKAYRRTVWGKQKKDALNARRYRRPQAIGQPLSSGEEASDGSEASNSSLVENGEQSLPAELSATFELDLDGVSLQESTVVHSPLLPYTPNHLRPSPTTPSREQKGQLTRVPVGQEP
jgi:hypothetical protein